MIGLPRACCAAVPALVGARSLLPAVLWRVGMLTICPAFSRFFPRCRHRLGSIHRAFVVQRSRFCMDSQVMLLGVGPKLADQEAKLYKHFY